ncbi:hypothetical protein [Namhaeicola litoreus]|uniref:Por secretion system C-terminal sorting domain-containing protein n=1 Tax=Namhaeicola litoreus TaxID=1052145 RepID=A0ABW3XY39_9FLAO
MKTIIKNTFVLALMLSATMIMARDIENPKNESIEKIAPVKFSNLKKGTLISIKDQNGIRIYKEEVKKDGNYAKSYNLSSLPEGNYKIEVEDKSMVKVIPLEITQSGVTVITDLEYIIMKPVVIAKDNMVTVSKLSFSKDNFTISIQNGSGDLIYSESISNQVSISKMFDFSKAAPGSYIIRMETEGRVFTETIHF